MIEPDAPVPAAPGAPVTPLSPPTTVIVKEAPSAPADPRAAAGGASPRIGILFVHGMGEQQRGASLQQWGDPIVQWIRRWESNDFDADRQAVIEPDPAAQAAEELLRTSGDDAAVNSTSSPLGYTVIRGESCDPSTFEPPTAEFTLQRPSTGSGDLTEATWVMAEAWWADSFFPPKFSDVAKWGLGVGPRFVVRHFELPTSGLPGWPQWLRYALALALVVIFELVIMLLLVLAAIPFARNYVKSLILKLIGSFGDPMVLVASPMTAAAIETAIDNGLNWLRREKKCGQVAVIAHSLGTVATYNLLAKNSDKVNLLVTFGAALKKARILQRVQQRDVRLSLGIVLATCAFAAFALAALITVLYWSSLPDDLQTTDHLGDWLRWLWLYGVLIGGVMLCTARLALWRRTGPRWVAPLGSLVAIVAGLCILATQPTARNPVSFGDLDIGDVGDVLASDDALRLLPFALAAVLATAREVWDIRRFRAASEEPDADKRAEAIRAVERTNHEAIVGSPMLNALMLAGTWLTCIDRWTPPQLIAPLLVTWLVLSLAAIRVPFGNGYIASDGEQEHVSPFAIAPTGDGAVMRWHDFWASADPVPDGGLAPGNVASSPRAVKLISSPVTNQKSMASDHTTYQENLEEFVGPVVAELMQLTGWTILYRSREDRDVVRTSRQRRRHRVACLPASMLVLAGSAAAIIGYLWFADLLLLSELGNKALAPVMGLLKLVISHGWVESLNRFLSGALFGALLIAAVASLWHRLVVFQAWRQWDKADQNAMFRGYPSSQTRHAAPPGKLPQAVRVREWAFYVVAFGVPLAAVALAWWFSYFDKSWWPTS